MNTYRNNKQLRNLVQEAVEEGMIDNFKQGANKFANKVKKGANKFANKVKKGYETYNEKMNNYEQEVNAAINPLYWDDEDVTNESLKHFIKESVKKVLKETSLYTDDPYHYDEYYNEDPRDEYPNGQQGDIDYSWDDFDFKHSNMQDYQHV